MEVPFIICVFDNFLHVALSDFYIVRKSWNCNFTAQNRMKIKLRIKHNEKLLSQTVPGKRFVHQNDVNYYSTFEANWLLKTYFSGKVILLFKAILQAQHPVNLSNWVHSLHHWRSKYWVNLLVFSFFLVEVRWQYGNWHLTIPDRPNINSCEKLISSPQECQDSPYITIWRGKK